MRILLFSDHHAHAWRPYSNILPEDTRLKDGIHVLHQIRIAAKEKKADVILFGGDLFHARGSIHVKTFNLVFEEIAKMAIHCRVGLLVGNHDQMNRQGDVHSVYAMGSIVTVMDKPGWYSFSPKGSPSPLNIIQVFALPYHSVKDDILLEIETGVSGKPRKLVPTMMLAHLGVDGAVVGSNFVLQDKTVLSVGQLRIQEFDQVFLGHYHEPQPLAPNARYLGATHHHNWGDVGSNRGYWIWDTGENDEYFEPKMFPIDYPRFVSVDVDGHYPPVKDCYVKIKHDRACNKDKIERELLMAGARVVEWQWEGKTAGQIAYTGAFRPGMDYEEMIESYVDEEDSILDEGMLIDMGKSIIRQVS